MNITIFAAGSRGDIQPCLALSKGLRQAGYTVQLAAPENFAAFAQTYEIDFSPCAAMFNKSWPAIPGSPSWKPAGATQSGRCEPFGR